MNAILGNVKRYDVSFTHGDGAWLYDSSGERYLDFLGGVAVCSLGHAHPAITQAIQEQAAKLLHVSNLFYTPAIVEAAEAINARLGMGRVYFCNSGTEANEAAIKAVRKHVWRRGEDQRYEIVAVEGSFHGRTLGALAATMQPAKKLGFGPVPDGFVSVPLNDRVALDKAVTNKTAAIIIEPIQGESGIRPLTPAYAQMARRLASERGAALVVDEIQTGVGRTGRWWGFEHLGITPDFVTLAKALGSGFPVGAMWTAEAFADSLQPGDHSTTQGGGPLACAAVVATLRTISSEGLVQRAEEIGKWLVSELEPLGFEIRGKGLLLGIELGAPRAAAVVKAALERRLIVNDVTPTTIRLAPPLIVTDGEADVAVRRLKDALAVAAGRSSDAKPLGVRGAQRPRSREPRK
ncbi:MAG TPA: aspartate aminotransferase family protein [Actinomycetota bacterium]|nr:aspartate aminotransferase family protein [Actinomycetota bacterium]